MQESKLFNEKRAEIYWWLSSLFAREINEKELATYHTPEIRSFISGLGETEQLKKSTTALVDALNRLQDREDAMIELAADFCGLFLTTDKNAALPYASMYIGKSGLLNDEPAQKMEALMHEKGISMQEGFNEPADHLAVELDFLGNLIIRSNECEKPEKFEAALLEQKAFIDEYLLSWVPQFKQNCQQFDEFGFYAAVAALLHDFLILDGHYLAGE